MHRSVRALRPERHRSLASAWLRAVLALTLMAAWTSAAAPAAHADGPTTFSNTASIAIPATGSANQTGPASPYPSTIGVSGMTGTVTAVTVTFHGLTHSTLNDVDALVVAPSGENLVVLSDIGDPNQLATANNITLTFDDAAANSVSPGAVPSGTFKPTNTFAGATDTWPAPAPAASNQTTLAGSFTGLSTANGNWQLFVVDDATGDLGTMAGGWSLTITTEVAAASTTTTVTSSDTTSSTGSPVTFTAAVGSGGAPVTAGTVQFTDGGANLGAAVPLNGQGRATLTTSALTEGTHLIRATFSGATGFLTSNGTVSQRVDNATTVTGQTFCNTGVITVPGNGSASPYPSNIFVTGLTGNVTKVTANLKGVSHTAPIDLDVLLSGPTPTDNLFLLSDGGGQNPVSNLNLIFDDAAASVVPDPATSGTFQPTRVADESVESLPAPAPALSAATALSTFNGKPANGTWTLWVFDDASGDSGSLSGGWCVTIETTVPTTTVLSAAPNPASHGESITLTATVTAGGASVTSGSVTFTDGATSLGSVPVDAQGVATFTTSTLANGTHPVTASYAANGSFGASENSLDVVVAATPTSTVLTAAPNPVRFGDPVTLTATVTAGAVPVGTGLVTFTEGPTTLGTVTLDTAGQATFSTSTLAAGTHTITASYPAGDDFGGSNNSVDVVVQPLPATVLTLTASPNPGFVGFPVTVRATVTSDGSPVSTGTVDFTGLGSVAVNAEGVAEFVTSSMVPGQVIVLAAYPANADYQGSSGTVSIVFDPVSFDAGGPYTVAEGDPLTLAGSGTAVPGVTYSWDLNGDDDFSDATGLAPTLSWAQLEALGIDDGPSSRPAADAGRGRRRRAGAHGRSQRDEHRADRSGDRRPDRNRRHAIHPQGRRGRSVLGRPGGTLQLHRRLGGRLSGGRRGRSRRSAGHPHLHRGRRLHGHLHRGGQGRRDQRRHHGDGERGAAGRRR